MRIRFLLALTLTGVVAATGARAQSLSAGDKGAQSACAQGSTTGVCRQYRLRAPPPPPERLLAPPKSSGEIVPPMERVPPPAPLLPRVGN
jgi:hypothetical protein